MERALRIVQHVLSGQEVTTKVLRDKFGLCRATAQRVMLDIERALPVTVEFRHSLRTTNGRPPPQRVLRVAKV
jgi:hypothetical protein